MKLEDIRPGYYIAIQKDDAVGIHGRVHINRLGNLCFQGEYSQVKWYLDSGWIFTRLVPAQEVEAAYLEGCIDGHNAAPTTDPSKEWDYSRAKRIAEGLE